MMKNLPASLSFIRTDEGGYIERATEPGGAGNFGVSFAVFQAYMKLRKHKDVGFADLKAMQSWRADEIYTEQYATPLRFGELPSGADYALLDCGVNLGVVGAIRMLQKRVLGFADGVVDGHFGLITQASLKDRSAESLAKGIVDAWLEEKKTSPEWHQFGVGWTARHDKVWSRILTLLH